MESTYGVSDCGRIIVTREDGIHVTIGAEWVLMPNGQRFGRRCMEPQTIHFVECVAAADRW